MEWCTGRLIDHVHLQVRDFGASRRFYLAVMDALRHPGPIALGDRHLQVDELYVEASERPASVVHLAFQADSVAMVDGFHAAALANGGRDNGAPGVRDYHDAYYAAFVLDPDGNNIEAVYQGPTERSAHCVRVRSIGRAQVLDDAS